jgi:glycopeptide antibiotics resistance protein
MSKETLFTVIIFNSLVLFIPLAAVLLYFRPRLWHYLFALFLGIVVGWLDRNASEVQGTVLLLLVFGLFMGFAQPKHAWRWALILGAFVTLMGFAAAAFGLKPFTVNETIGSLIAFVPAFFGTYSGAFVNRMSLRVTRASGATS